MTEQPEALFLADELEAPLGTVISGEVDKRAAAELRRLHEENERLNQINQWHEMKLSVRGYVIQVDDLKAANAELLEALKLAEAGLADIGDADREPEDDLAWCERRAAEPLPIIRATIAKAEGRQSKPVDCKESIERDPDVDEFDMIGGWS
jgi:hypothetical protein